MTQHPHTEYDFHAALLRHELARLSDMLDHLTKAGFNPNQPRAPRGSPIGGQWVGTGSPISGGVSQSVLVGGPGKDKVKVPKSWERKDQFEEHYKKHAKDFGDVSRQEYAEQARKFRKYAEQNKLPAIRTRKGYIKYYDPKTNTFGTYHRNGRTETFYKPASRHYFETVLKDELRRGGRIVNPYHAPSGVIFDRYRHAPTGSRMRIPIPQAGGFGSPPRPGRTRPFTIDDILY